MTTTEEQMLFIQSQVNFARSPSTSNEANIARRAIARVFSYDTVGMIACATEGSKPVQKEARGRIREVYESLVEARKLEVADSLLVEERQLQGRWYFPVLAKWRAFKSWIKRAQRSSR